MTFLHCEPGRTRVGKPGQGKGHQSRGGRRKAFISRSEVQPQLRSAVTESCHLPTPLQQPAGVDGCPHCSQPWHSPCPHLVGWTHLPAPPASCPSRLRGHGPQQLCWVTRQRQVLQQSPSSNKPFSHSPSAEEGLSLALFLKKGEIHGLEHHPWWTTVNHPILPGLDMACLPCKRSHAG